MSIFRKTAVAVLAAAALTGLGAGVAAAAPATLGSADQHDIRFFNASPYQMYIAKVDAGLSPTYQGIQPGQTITVSAADLARNGLGGQLEVAEYDYSQGVTDIDAITTNGYQPGATPCTAIAGRTDTPAMGCLVQAPNIIAGETGPMQITIWTNNPKHKDVPVTFDANTGDKVAMGNFLDGLATFNPALVTFDTNTASVEWGYGKQVQVGPSLFNCNPETAHEGVHGDQTFEEGTNVTGTFSISQGIKLFDTVDTEISASISVGHSWTSSVQTGYDVGEDIGARKVGWFGAIPSTESVTGTVTATSAAGYPVQFSNVTFIEPGMTPTHDSDLDYQYIGHSRDMTADEIQSKCMDSSAATATQHDKVVTGGAVADVTAGAKAVKVINAAS